MSSSIFEDTMVEMTWCQVEEAAKQNAIVLLPTGIIEEHSRHLPLGTDIYIASAQAREIAMELRKNQVPCIIAPPFYWGITSVLTKHFPGTFNAREETMIALITDILTDLERAGFRRVVTVNAHGDPKHREAIVKAFRQYNQEHELQARWLTFEEDLKMEGFQGEEDYILTIPTFPFEQLMKLTKEPVDAFDVHAGAFETALMRDLYPTLTDMETAKQLSPSMLDQEGIQKWCSGKIEDVEVIPDGHAGDPSFSQYISTDLGAADIAIAHGIMLFYDKKEQMEREKNQCMK